MGRRFAAIVSRGCASNCNPSEIAANEAVQAQLAESNEAKEKIGAAAKERDRWRPTPTQEENDRAKLGEVAVLFEDRNDLVDQRLYLIVAGILALLLQRANKSLLI